MLVVDGEFGRRQKREVGEGKEKEQDDKKLRYELPG
jgi:hypothetical protein